MRILEISEAGDLKKIMQDIRVDPFGIKIMLPKALNYLIKINSLSNIAANILKQEMLSLGADVAIAKDALTGKTRLTDCLLIGNQSQYRRLYEKLDKQPFGLGKLAKDLSSAINNYQRDVFLLQLGRYRLDFGRHTHIMGIVNLTPDSFSGDGLLKNQKSPLQIVAEKVKSQSYNSKFKINNFILDYAQQLVEDGADIIDVGGESSRPGARPVSVKEELSRVIPVIKVLAKKIKAPISIDTYKPEVAQCALDNGAVMLNDIWGLRDLKMARVAAKYHAGCVIMHMQGSPRTMQRNPLYQSLMDEIIEFLAKSMQRAEAAGINKERIILDPGIGFGKTLGDNLGILKRLREFKILARPLLVGTSRKSFLGKILNAEPQQRLFGTISSCVLAAGNGANILRVHDVKEVKEALKVADALNR